MVREHGNVFDAIAQRRHVERDHVEPVEQVLAKVAAFDFVFEILVRGGHDADIHLDRFGRTHRLQTLFFQRAQDFGLRLERHVADLVEEQSAAVGPLELTDLVLQHAGETALAMAEQLAFDHLFGNGGAVDLDEGVVGARAGGMDRAGDQFLARTAFSKDQDAAIGGGHELQLLPQRLHRNAFADDAIALTAGQLAELGLQFVLLQGVVDHHRDLFNGQRLFEEIEGAELGGADGGFDGAVAGNHHNFGTVRGGDLLNVSEGFQTIDAREPDIQQDNVVAMVREFFQALLAGFDGFAGESLVFEYAGERFANPRFIVNNQDVGLLHSSTSTAVVISAGGDAATGIST